MPVLASLAPTHLSIFVMDPENRRPVARLPLYAEVAAPRIVPRPRPNERFREPIRAALDEADPTANGAVRDRVVAAAMEVAAENVQESSLNQLVSEADRVRELYDRVFRRTLAAAQRQRMADIPPAELKPLIVAALRSEAAERGLDLVPEVAHSRPAATKTVAHGIRRTADKDEYST